MPDEEREFLLDYRKPIDLQSPTSRIIATDIEQEAMQAKDHDSLDEILGELHGFAKQHEIDVGIQRQIKFYKAVLKARNAPEVADSSQRRDASIREDESKTQGETPPPPSPPEQPNRVRSIVRVGRRAIGSIGRSLSNGTRGKPSGGAGRI